MRSERAPNAADNAGTAPSDGWHAAPRAVHAHSGERCLTDIADYFGWYNTSRPHSSLDRITPEQAYLDLLPKLAEAA